MAFLGKDKTTAVLRNRSHQVGGFTLIELLTVMAIMVLVTTIAISNYSGITRAAAYRAAQDVVFNTLQAAKQRACIGGRDVFVVFSGTNEFTLVESCGTISQIDKDGHLYDFYPNFDDVVTNSPVCIWNLSGKSIVTNSVKIFMEPYRVEDVPLHSNDKVYEIARIRKMEGEGKTGWAVGDKYGMEVSQVQRVAKGYKIDVDSPDKAIHFYPDGSTSEAKITVSEFGLANPLSFEIKVEGGEIKCE